MEARPLRTITTALPSSTAYFRKSSNTKQTGYQIGNFLKEIRLFLGSNLNVPSFRGTARINRTTPIVFRGGRSRVDKERREVTCQVGTVKAPSVTLVLVPAVQSLLRSPTLRKNIFVRRVFQFDVSKSST